MAYDNLKMRMAERIMKIESTKDEGVYAKAYLQDAKEALEAIHGLEAKTVGSDWKQRGVDFPCEGCGAKDGSTLSDGWYRCNQCGYPGK